MTEFTIYIDALQEGDWFQSLSPRLSDAELVTFQSAEPPPVVSELTSYDQPDIILLRDKDPVLVVEKTGHKPTGKNPLQRVARMVKAAEMAIPSVIFIPYEVNHPGTDSGKYNLNHRLIDSLRSVSDIHDVEILIPPWPSDDENELIQDGSENELIGEFIDQFLANDCEPAVPAAETIRTQTNAESKRILNEYSGYKQPPPSVGFVDTGEYLNGIRAKLDGRRASEPLPNRNESVVCTFDTSSAKSGRVDPYGGAQFAYDYLYCRTGSSRTDRERNLVLKIPQVSKTAWLEMNPYEPQNKSSLWYKCADAIELEDTLLVDFEQYRCQQEIDQY